MAAKAKAKGLGSFSLACVVLASMSWGASARADPTPSRGCVEQLLLPPTPAKVAVERAGRDGTGAGKGQAVHATFDYPSVEGCASLGRVPQIRIETKATGRWRPAEGSDTWVDAPTRRTSSGQVEVTWSGGGAAAFRCEGGHRPPVRVQLRTRVKDLATGRNLGQSPVHDFLASYEPASSARC
jgi:hypothetical protein